MHVPRAGVVPVTTNFDLQSRVTWQYAHGHPWRRWAGPSRNGEAPPYGPWLHNDEIAVIAL
jgi:hypothetical protein